MQQRSEEWFAARAGKATASRIADVIAKTRSGWGASRKNYMAELVAERLTGQCAQGYVNAAMQHGIDTEPEARRLYAFMADMDAEEIGFVDHPEIAMSGASPDGLVGDKGLVEIKCPNTATHIDTLLGSKLADKYQVQMLWQMACTGRDWCDFVSYDPRLPEPMQLYIERFERDDTRIGELEEMVAEFLAEVDETVARLRERYEQKEAA